eukprot:2696588-Rhodomonas_salina.1
MRMRPCVSVSASAAYQRVASSMRLSVSLNAYSRIHTIFPRVSDKLSDMCALCIRTPADAFTICIRIRHKFAHKQY